MRANTGLHSDQTRGHVREPCFDLAARPPLPQHDRAASGEADDMKRVLADVEAPRGNGHTWFVGHGGAPRVLAQRSWCRLSAWGVLAPFLLRGARRAPLRTS